MPRLVNADHQNDAVIIGLTVTALLIFTAIGDAMAMAIVSAVGCVVGLLLCKGRITRWVLVSVMVAFTIAYGIAYLLSS